jgi:hypothetical protein
VASEMITKRSRITIVISITLFMALIFFTFKISYLLSSLI